MKLKQPSYRSWLYTALSFLIPFLGMTILLFINKYSPFGKLSLLYSDMYHQYYPFFKEFRATLLSGESLLFNWSVGLGVDYLGLYSYYLGSPLNLLSVLVPESALLGYFSMLMPIKLGLASMFFGIFLQKIFHKHDLSVPLFSSFYGLCAWALGYQWNIMWLDTFALLPLVMLGMISLLRDKKFVLYTVTLCLSVAINYYIGFFTCIFVLLTFFCYEICRVDTRERIIKDFFRIAFFSIIGIGMTAIVTLPALASLQSTQSSVNSFPNEIRFNMNYWNQTIWGLMDSMAQVAGNMNGGFSPSLKEGLPNVYCGVFANLLAALYLFCPSIRRRDKVCAAGVLFFINISFVIRQLDYIWHGFHFTNMIPYRFSFLYSFVLLYMAYAAWVNRKHFRPWDIGLATVAAVSIIFCHNDLKDEGFLAYNAGLLLLYVVVLIIHGIKPKAPAPAPVVDIATDIAPDSDIAPDLASDLGTALNPDLEKETKEKKRLPAIPLKAICSLGFLCIMLGEMVLNLMNFSSSFPPTNANNYPANGDAVSDVIAYMNYKEADNPFFRTEVTHSQTLNDGALNGYNGISTFTSSANVNVTKFMVALGYGAKDTYNRYCYEEASPVANMFMNLKYMIERDGNVETNPYFDDVYANSSVHLLENNIYLPLGFMTTPQITGVDFSENLDRFVFQNKLMKAATGIDKDVWSSMDVLTITPAAGGPTLTNDLQEQSAGYCTYDNKDKSTNSHIAYSYTAEKAGFVCVYIERSEQNDFSLWHNGKFLYVEGFSLPQMASVCTVKPGDKVEVWLNCKAGQSGSATVKAAVLNEEVLRQHHAKLSESTLNISHFSNARIEGTVNCLQSGVLYTSIPQNGNWQAIVDGVPAETVTIGNAMLGVKLTEGTHNITFEYRNTAFTLGLTVTAVFALILAGAYVIMYHTNLFKKKQIPQ